MHGENQEGKKQIFLRTQHKKNPQSTTLNSELVCFFLSPNQCLCFLPQETITASSLARSGAAAADPWGLPVPVS
jgi:hypothetical protein